MAVSGILSPGGGSLKQDSVRAALYYARKRRLARIAASLIENLAGLFFLYAGDSRSEKSISPYPQSYIITAASRSSNVVTLTFRDAHGISISGTQLQAITGLDASFNQPNGVTVTATTTTQVTYTLAGANGSSTLTGGKALKLSTYYLESNHPLAWGLGKCDGRATCLDTNYGKGGLTTTTFIAGNEFSDLKARLTALGGGNVFFLLGTNNSNAGTALATTQAEILEIIDGLTACAAPGRVRIAWANETPRPSADDTLHLGLKNWIDTLPTLRDYVYVADTWSVTAQDASTNEWIVGLTDDDVHPNVMGAAVMGDALATTIRAMIADNDFTLLYQDNPVGVLNNNPTLAGNGGTDSGGWVDVPTGWVGSGSASGFTLTMSDETRDGIAGKLITLSGQSTTAHPALTVYQALDISGLSLGDSVFCAGLVQVDSLENVRTYSLEMQSTGISWKTRALDGYDDTNLPPDTLSFVQTQRTPPLLYATGVTGMRAGLTIEPAIANTPISGTIWIAQITAREYDETLALPTAFEPINSVAPGITGTAQVGQTLTCSTGTWLTGRETISYAYQWKADGEAIDGATSSTYTLTADEQGKVITCVVTATNASGSAEETTSATSAVSPTYVNSVKFYEVTLGTGQTSNTVTIDEVGDKALIFPTFESSGTSTAPSATQARVEFTNSTTLTLIRNTASSVTVKAKIMVIDATDSLVDSVQYGTISLAAATSNTAAITPVDATRSIPVYLGMTTDTGSQSAGRQNGRVTLTDEDTITGNTSNAITGTLGFMIIDWADASVTSVQNIVTTLTSANTSDAATISSVDVNRSLVFNGGQSGALSSSPDLCYTSQLTGPTALTHTRGGTAVTSRTVNRSVVQFATGVLDGNVQRGTIDLTGVTNNNATISDIGTAKGAVVSNGWRTSTVSAQPTLTFASLTRTNGTTPTASINGAANTTVAAYEAAKFT